MKISAIALAATLLGGASTSSATKMMTPKTMKDDEKETYLRSLQSSEMSMSIPSYIEEASAEEAEPSDWLGNWADKLSEACYTVETETMKPTQIVPVKTAEDASTFYGYDNKKYPFNLSSDISGITNGALVLLHQDTTTDIVSLIFLAGNTALTQLGQSGVVVFTGVEEPVRVDDTSPPAKEADRVEYYKEKVSVLKTYGVLTFDFKHGLFETDGIVAPLEFGKCATVNLVSFSNVKSLEVDDGTGYNIVFGTDEVLTICRSKCEE